MLFQPPKETSALVLTSEGRRYLDSAMGLIPLKPKPVPVPRKPPPISNEVWENIIRTWSQK